MNIKNPLVSIIVPFWNVDSYIEECLSSILRQTYINFEVICVNDCSQDNSIFIAQSFCSDARFRVVSHMQNRGLGAARNTGIGEAKGEYICFVDSDDYLDPDYLSFLLKGIQGKDLAVCAIKMLDNETGEKVSNSACHNHEVVRRALDIETCELSLVTDLYPSAWNKLYRLEVITNNDIKFPEGVFYEDHYFYYKYLSVSKAIKYVQNNLYVYRHNRAGQITGNGNHKVYDIFRVLEQVEDLFNESHCFAKGQSFFDKIAVRLLWERLFVVNMRSRSGFQFLLASRKFLEKRSIRSAEVKDNFIGSYHPLIVSKMVLPMLLVIYFLSLDEFARKIKSKLISSKRFLRRALS